MLLRFAVTNHLSLHDKQELSLVASSLDDRTEGLIACRHVPGKHLLPAVVIYGTNASGKSNLVDAFRWVKEAVCNSHSRGEPSGPVARTPFALDPDCALAPTAIEIDFVVDDVRYHYGFEASDSAFLAEWLYSFPNERRQMLFEREVEKFRFGRQLKGHNQVIADLTRPNSLFVSAAAQNRHAELTRVVGFFRGLSTDVGQATEGWQLADRLFGKPIENRIIAFLDASGTGIVGYRAERTPLADEFERLIQYIRDHHEKHPDTYAARDFIEEKPLSLELAHKGKDQRPVYLDFSEESVGTRRLIALLLPVFRALDAGTPIIVDELDSSLHTHACEMLFELFASPATNPKGAQLIATTHDTNLLCSKHLRRDQVWFTEKDHEGATHLYPLTEFRTRKSDNLARGYLQGRYGAIPFAGRAADLTSRL